MAAQKSRHPPWKTIGPSVHLDDLRTDRQRTPGNCPAGLQLVARTYWVIDFMAKLRGLFHAWESLLKLPGVLGCWTSPPWRLVSARARIGGKRHQRPSFISALSDLPIGSALDWEGKTAVVPPLGILEPKLFF